MSRSNQPETVEIPINNFIFSDDLTNPVDESKDNSNDNNDDLAINIDNEADLPPEKPNIDYSLLHRGSLSAGDVTSEYDSSSKQPTTILCTTLFEYVDTGDLPL